MKNPNQLNNGQVRQSTQDLSPADGNGGYVGDETGSALGMTIVEGKKGFSTDQKIWGHETSESNDNQNTGSGDVKFGGQDSTDEYATYKRVQTDTGLPQTYRDSAGAGDAGPSGSDEPEVDFDGEPDTQSVPSSKAGDYSASDLPQTEFTHKFGGGAPLFKVSK